MTSQLYLSGTVASEPLVGETRKGRLMVRVLIKTDLVRETRPAELQSEQLTLPVTFFSTPAEIAKNLRLGDPITIGAHLYGTEFHNSDGAVKHGVQLIADTLALLPTAKGDLPP